MATPSRISALRSAMANYSGSKGRLLLRVHRCLQELVDSDFILDSSKGVMMDKKWLLQSSGSKTCDVVAPHDVVMLDDPEVGKLANWVNTMCAVVPQAAEDLYVYWSSTDKANKYLTNIAAFMTGANLYERSIMAKNKGEMVDCLLSAMKRSNKDTSRAAASGLANGIIKFYEVILKCGEDAVFNCRFSVRSFRNMKREACTNMIDRLEGLGGLRMDRFLNDLLDDHPLKTILEQAMDLIGRHRDVSKVKIPASSIHIQHRERSDETTSERSKITSDISDDGSDDEFDDASESDADHVSDVERSENEKEESGTSVSGNESKEDEDDEPSVYDADKANDGPDVSAETPILGEEAPQATPRPMQIGQKRVRLGPLNRDGRRIAQRVPMTRSQRKQCQGT
jgi:hypothetical protein